MTLHFQSLSSKWQNNHAYSMLEMLTIIAVVFAIIVFLVLPHLNPGSTKSPRITCVNNLKQIGLGFQIWAADHNDQFPMESFTNKNGAPLFAYTSHSFRYFQLLSNKFHTPRILVCPKDSRRIAKDFTAEFTGQNLSYFLGLKSDESHPSAFLSGDRNLTNGRKPENGMLEVQANQNIRWTGEIHRENGNLLHADGTVYLLNNDNLKRHVAQTGMATNQLLIP